MGGKHRDTQQYNECDELDFHGCSIRVYLKSCGIITHQTFNGESTLTIRSHPDGLEVGCTFITSEALKKIYEWHQDFLGKQGPKTHQSSSV